MLKCGRKTWILAKSDMNKIQTAEMRQENKTMYHRNKVVRKGQDIYREKYMEHNNRMELQR